MKNTTTTRPEYVYEKPTHGHFKDLTGKTFGRLLVESFAYKKRVGETAYHIFYNCKCECLKNCVVSSGSLKSGHTKSCGCYHKEKITNHGLYKHPLYTRCIGQINRCHNPNRSDYKDYGGRGIKVFEKWRNNLPLMIKEMEAEIGLPPSKNYEIDRIDNDGDYEPGNLRWILSEPNCRNRRNTHNHTRDPITKKVTSTYDCWRNMNKRDKKEVCKEWINDNDSTTTNGFQQFLADMGEKKGILKRYDKAVSFCKENCYWG